MANFMLLLYDDPKGWYKLTPEQMQQAMAKYMGWGEKAKAAGFYVTGHRLADDPGKLLSGKGSPRVTDGPFIESKEVLGGFYIIKADSYEQAVERSRDHPHMEFGGTIEVRQEFAAPK
jgi:hypothetical protein